METLQISKEKALKAYNGANDKGKKLLQDLFGVNLFTDPIEWFKTWEDICEHEDMDPVRSLPYPNPATKKQVSVNGAFKLETIFEVFNQGKEFDFGNSDQEKWFPWHDWNASVSAFVFGRTFFTCTYSALGSRLCTDTDAKATYIGKQFNKEWNEFLNPKI